MDGNKLNGNEVDAIGRTGSNGNDEMNGNNGNLADKSKENGNSQKAKGNSEAESVELGTNLEQLRRAKDIYGTVNTMPTVTLSNGYEMPALSVGTALVPEAEVEDVVRAAIELGYRHVDTAMIYGGEEEIGRAIRGCIQSGTITREDLFVTSKLWSTFHRSELAVQACRETLGNLGLEYLDLLLIHNPMSFKEGPSPVPMVDGVIQYSETGDYMDAWSGLEELVRAGLVRSIGLSNFNSEQISRILSRATIRPVVNQVECHPYLAQTRLDEFCSRRDIKLSCYGSLGSAGTPEGYISVGKPVLADQLVRSLAVKYDRTEAQILLRYQLERGHSAVVKTSSAGRLWENLQAVRFAMRADDVRALSALDAGERHFTFKGMGDTHRNYPFNIAF